MQAQDEDEDGAEMNAQGIAHRFAVHECVKIERQYKLWCMDPAATSSVVQLRAGYSIDLGQMVSSAEVPIGRKDYVVESAQVGSATNTDNDVADVAEPPPEFFEVNGRTVSGEDGEGDEGDGGGGDGDDEEPLQAMAIDSGGDATMGVNELADMSERQLAQGYTAGRLKMRHLYIEYYRGGTFWLFITIPGHAGATARVLLDIVRRCKPYLIPEGVDFSLPDLGLDKDRALDRALNPERGREEEENYSGLD